MFYTVIIYGYTQRISYMSSDKTLVNLPMANKPAEMNVAFKNM